MKLYDRLPDRISVDGKTYTLLPAFDNVLAAVDTLRMEVRQQFIDDRLCRLLIKDRVRPEKRHRVAMAALNILIDRAPSSERRSFDFEQDAKYIYAAFRQAYGINLFEEQGRLHWWEFIALFSALPEDARIIGIMRIRTEPLPAPTKHNSQQWAALIRQKRAFALHCPKEETEQNCQAGLQKLAAMIMR